MSFKSTILATVAAASFALPAIADSIMVHDAYARSSGKSAKAGAAFMMLMNHGDADDRLIAVRSEAAARVELHTHKEDAAGVMKMMEVKEGFLIPAGGSHMLDRGGDHVMLMGLTEPFEHGDVITFTLVFETAGEMNVEIPIDLERKGGHNH